ncbi:hypothetical protein [Fibrella aquatilis]|uniref:Uncharacterized protein n=1 Tax=Fibrella aquatilis TaxID=2817059 RepID=A0A939G500_9BACT|nr:hypothetical protein [Fibrella aquatilis]MBO0929898.1 hypothetical protein [Fibrella aquatilis]
MATRTLKKPAPLLVQGRNATGKVIEGIIPAGTLSQEDPGLTIQRILSKRKGLVPTPVEPQ